ncbi:hypothetical protein Q7P37_006128 [Cladosporium fusiforme]
MSDPFQGTRADVNHGFIHEIPVPEPGNCAPKWTALFNAPPEILAAARKVKDSNALQIVYISPPTHHELPILIYTIHTLSASLTLDVDKFAGRFSSNKMNDVICFLSPSVCSTEYCRIPIALENGCNHVHLSLLRLVSINDKDQPTLPVRVIWATIDRDDGKVLYEAFSAQSVYDTDEEEMSIDEPCKTLNTDTDLSHVTQVVRGGTCFWKETSDEHGQKCYIVDEETLKMWLDNGAGTTSDFEAASSEIPSGGNTPESEGDTHGYGDLEELDASWAVQYEDGTEVSLREHEAGCNCRYCAQPGGEWFNLQAPSPAGVSPSATETEEDPEELQESEEEEEAEEEVEEIQEAPGDDQYDADDSEAVSSSESEEES